MDGVPRARLYLEARRRPRRPGRTRGSRARGVASLWRGRPRPGARLASSPEGDGVDVVGGDGDVRVAAGAGSGGDELDAGEDLCGNQNIQDTFNISIFE